MEGFVTNLDLFMFIKNNSCFSKPNVLVQKLLEVVNDLTQAENKLIKQFCQTYVCDLHKKWGKGNRTTHSFIKKYETWLQEEIKWPDFFKSKCEIGMLISEEQPSTSSTTGDKANISTSQCSVGTSTSKFSPRKPFTELSPIQKRRRVEPLFSYEKEALAFATGASSGDKNVSDLVKYITEHPERAADIKDFLKGEKKVTKYSAEKALAILVSLKLSKWQYSTLRACAKEDGVELYPANHVVLDAKKQCYPPKEAIAITDRGVRVKIQAILDKTVERLGKVVEISTEIEELTLVCKWGFDGASGPSTYKQAMEGEDDSSIFMCSFVPLRLTSGEKIIWENLKPSSTMLCRPIYFEFSHENKLNTKQEKAKIDDEIAVLEPSFIGNNIRVNHSMLMTMIDGKITTHLSDTSTQTCDICKAVPSEMNKLEIVSSKPVSTEIYQYGLSSLHAWIRSMECLLHIAYRLDFKKWQAKDTICKEALKIKKQVIQKKFREEMGLIVDVVKQGSGTSNDGNTARRFFCDPEKTAVITGLNLDLIKRFATILGVISSGELINIDAFANFATGTAQMYVELYEWYYMPSSVHKLLIHGAEIIKHFGLMPIGNLSEEASEARNKDFKNIRELHSRKFSRIATNEDIFNGLLVSSDPFISNMRPVMRKPHKKELTDDMVSLLLINNSDKNKENVEFVDVNASISDSELDISDNEDNIFV